MLKKFYPQSGFVNGINFQSATRLTTKLEFIVGILSKALRATGAENFRGVQVMLGEVISWRNLMWSLTETMARVPQDWSNGAVTAKHDRGDDVSRLLKRGVASDQGHH